MNFISWPAHKDVFENPVEARRKVSPTPNTEGLKVLSPGSTGSSLKKVDNQEQQHQLLLLRSLPQCR